MVLEGGVHRGEGGDVVSTTELPRAACILVGGSDRKIKVGAVVYLFEDHPSMGPCPVTPTGRERMLAPHSAFWTAVTRWYDDGKQIDAEGLCVWTPPPDPREGMVLVPGVGWMSPEMAAELMAAFAPAGKPS